MKQDSQESNNNYLARFKTNVAAVELTGGKYIFASLIISGLPIEEMTTEELDEEIDKSKAIILLKCADESRFNPLAKRLKEATYLDQDEYPTSLATMYELMTKSYSNIQSTTNNNNSRNRRNGVSLLQRNDTNENEGVPGTDGRTFDIICYNCNRRGHYVSSCPETNTTIGISNLQYGYMMTQTLDKRGLIPPDWVLLNTCSTDNIIHNISLMMNTRKCSRHKEMKIHTNGGSLSYDTIGVFKYLPITCFYNTKSIANVLSLKSVSDVPECNIHMGTTNSPEIYINYGNMTLKFSQSTSGLYYCNIQDLESFHEGVKFHQSVISLLSTNHNVHSKATIIRAKSARNLQKAMMWPSSSMMKKLIKNNLITDTDITEKDFDIADEIFGKALEQLKGKMTTPSQKKDNSSQILLHDIKIQINRRIKLYIDIMYVCGCSFLHIISKDINYITIQYLPDRKSSTVAKKLKLVVRKYLSRGFTITDVFGDNEFSSEKYKNLLMPATLHICSKGEHVPIIKRSIRTVNERARSATVELPFGTIPQLMVISLLEGVERWMNAFPTEDINKDSVSSATVIKGRENPADNVSRIAYGSYALVYTGTSNTLNSRSVPAIALRESNNNGGHYFMLLESGQRIHSNKWVEMPITQVQINCVHEIATTEGNDYWLEDLIYHDNPVVESSQISTASYAVCDDTPIILSDEDQAIDARIQDANQNLDTDEMTDEMDHIESSTESYTDSKDSTYKDTDEDNISIIPSVVGSGDYTFNIQNTYELDSNSDQDISDSNLENIPSINPTSNCEIPSSISDLDLPVLQLGSEETSSTSNNTGDAITEPSVEGTQLFQVQDSYEKAVRVMFTLISAHKGIKLFGEKAITAMMKELKQLNDGVIPGNPVIEPIPFEKLTAKDKKEALEAVNIIAQKRSGKIKGRTCANGSRQRRFLRDDENHAFPTASLESIMTMLVINAHENRDITIADVPGEYLHAQFPKEKNVILRMTDIFVDIMCDANKEYKNI